jgi:hypothetical protein
LQIVRKAGIPRLVDDPRNDGRRNAPKLTAQDHKDIVQRYKDGERVEDIAAYYGINPSGVYYHAHKAGLISTRQRKPKESARNETR